MDIRHVRSCASWLTLGAVLLASGILTAGAVDARAAAPRRPWVSVAHRVTQTGLSMPFIANHGQVDRRVAFYAGTFAGTAFVTRQGALVLSLPGRLPKPSPAGAPAARRGPGWILTETPVSRASLRPAGEGRAATRVSIFDSLHGRPRGRNSGTWNAVRVGEPWPGVSYAIRAHGNTIERVFTLAPGAHAAPIRMRVTGALRLQLHDGALVAMTGNGPVTLSRPVAYQAIRGRRRAVAVAYRLAGDRYGFRLGLHDPHHAVVIDPLIQATYLGGNDANAASSIAVGPQGQVYVAGTTGAIDFPHVSGGAFTTCTVLASSCYNTAFVAELTGDLSALSQVTFLAGSIKLSAIAVNSAGDVLVGGQATGNFPVSSNAAETTETNTINGNGGYVAMFSPDLTQLLHGTFAGGVVDGIAFGSAGQVYVTGSTYTESLPGVAGGAETLCDNFACNATQSQGDAFVTEFSADLTTLTQSTYFGGLANDAAAGIAIDATGDVYIAGRTGSPALPGQGGGMQTQNGGSGSGNSCGFAAKFNAGLTQIVQSTFLCNTFTDSAGATAIAIAPNGNVYLAGYTDSPYFPGVTGGAFATPVQPPGSPTFVAEINPALTAMVQATYAYSASALAIAPDGRVYVAGSYFGPAASPITGGAQPDPGGLSDLWLGVFNSGLTQFQQATWYGGSNSDYLGGIALGSGGQIYAAGDTNSTDLPMTGGAQSTCALNSSNQCIDAFIAELSGDLKSQALVSASWNVPSHAVIGGTFNDTLSITNASPLVSAPLSNNATGVAVTIAIPAQVTLQSATASQGACTVAAGSVTCTLGTLAANGGAASVTLALQAASAGTATVAAVTQMDEDFAPGSIAQAQSATQVLAAPAITGLHDVSVTPSASGTEAFSISGSGALTLSAASSNTALLPAAGISGASACVQAGSCALTLTPTSAMTGSSTITVTLTDSYGDSATQTFVLTVAALPPPATGGGGGAIDVFDLLALASLVALRAFAARRARTTGRARHG